MPPAREAACKNYLSFLKEFKELYGETYIGMLITGRFNWFNIFMEMSKATKDLQGA